MHYTPVPTSCTYQCIPPTISPLSIYGAIVISGGPLPCCQIPHAWWGNQISHHKDRYNDWILENGSKSHIFISVYLSLQHEKYCIPNNISLIALQGIQYSNY